MKNLRLVSFHFHAILFCEKKMIPRHLDPMLFVGLAFTYGTLDPQKRIGPKP
jgi:hypothetical protein